MGQDFGDDHKLDKLNIFQVILQNYANMTAVYYTGKGY